MKRYQRFALVAIFVIVAVGVLSVVSFPRLFEYLLLRRIEDDAGVLIKSDSWSIQSLDTFKCQHLEAVISESFIVKAEHGLVQCSFSDLLFGLKLPLKAKLNKVVFKFQDEMLGAIGADEVLCDFIKTSVTIGTSGEIIINDFFATGSDGKLNLHGSVKGDEAIDLNIEGQLSRSFLDRIPEFISTNLFYDGDEPFREIHLTIKGNPKRPNVNFQTDLVKFTIREHAQTS